jgi:hypothetical protein
MQHKVVEASVAFWKATLRGDAEARHWLEGGGFSTALGDLGKFEQKRAEPVPTESR